MDRPRRGDRGWPRRGLFLAAAAVLLVLGGSVSAFSLWLGRPGELPPPRPFTAPAKRALVQELETALALRLRYSYTRAMVVHAQRAAALARAHGQKALAGQITSAFASSCRVGGAEYHLRLALRWARGLPVTPARRQPGPPPTLPGRDL